jgi:hypothetical protein
MPLEDAGDAGEVVTDHAEAGIDASWCARQTPRPDFCEDFDEGTLGTHWIDQVITDGASLERDSVKFASAPASVRMVVGPRESCDYVRLIGPSVANAPVTYLGVAFDVFPDPSIPLGESHALGAEATTSVPGSSTTCSYYFYGGRAVTKMTMENSNGSTTGYDFSTIAAPGDCAHIEYEVSGASGQVPTVKVTANGQVVVDHQAVPSACKLGGAAELRLGLLCVDNGAAPTVVNFDNVAVWTHGG